LGNFSGRIGLQGPLPIRLSVRISNSGIQEEVSMSYGGNPPPGYPPQGYPPPGYPPPSYPQPGGYQPGGYGYAPAPQYASVGKRLGAVIIDSLIGMVGALPGIIIMVIGGVTGAATADSRGNITDGAAVGMMVLGYALLFIGALGVGIYNIYLLGKTGSTIGKRVMKIKVLDQNGQPLGFWKAFARELVKGIIGNVCFILWLWPLWDQEKQGLYDKLFSTHVYEA
jgi:uncharacterized RDD family membrane protein YckC